MNLAQPGFPIVRDGETAILVLRELGDEFIWAKPQLAEELRQQVMTNIVIDCEGARCFDCAALGQLLKLSRSIAGTQGHVALCGLSTLQMEMLRLVKLHHRWPIFDSRAEALQAIAQAAGRASSGRRF